MKRILALFLSMILLLSLLASCEASSSPVDDDEDERSEEKEKKEEKETALTSGKIPEKMTGFWRLDLPGSGNAYYVSVTAERVSYFTTDDFKAAFQSYFDSLIAEKGVDAVKYVISTEAVKAIDPFAKFSLPAVVDEKAGTLTTEKFTLTCLAGGVQIQNSVGLFTPEEVGEKEVLHDEALYLLYDEALKAYTFPAKDYLPKASDYAESLKKLFCPGVTFSKVIESSASTIYTAQSGTFEYTFTLGPDWFILEGDDPYGVNFYIYYSEKGSDGLSIYTTKYSRDMIVNAVYSLLLDTPTAPNDIQLKDLFLENKGYAFAWGPFVIEYSEVVPEPVLSIEVMVKF